METKVNPQLKSTQDDNLENNSNDDVLKKVDEITQEDKSQNKDSDEVVIK